MSKIIEAELERGIVTFQREINLQNRTPKDLSKDLDEAWDYVRSIYEKRDDITIKAFATELLKSALKVHTTNKKGTVFHMQHDVGVPLLRFLEEGPDGSYTPSSVFKLADKLPVMDACRAEYFSEVEIRSYKERLARLLRFYANDDMKRFFFELEEDLDGIAEIAGIMDNEFVLRNLITTVSLKNGSLRSPLVFLRLNPEITLPDEAYVIARRMIKNPSMFKHNVSYLSIFGREAQRYVRDEETTYIALPTGRVVEVWALRYQMRIMYGHADFLIKKEKIGSHSIVTVRYTHSNVWHISEEEIVKKEIEALSKVMMENPEFFYSNVEKSVESYHRINNGKYEIFLLLKGIYEVSFSLFYFSDNELVFAVKDLRAHEALRKVSAGNWLPEAPTPLFAFVEGNLLDDYISYVSALLI